MQISSLASILSAVINSFTDETQSISHVKEYSFGNLGNFKYLTFYQNAGQAILCPGRSRGYMTFNMIVDGENLFATIPNDNDLALDVVPVGNPNSYKVIISTSTSAGSLLFPTVNNTDHELTFLGDVNPSINGVPYMFFNDDDAIQHDGANCYPLWIALSSATQYGWSSTTLHYNIE